MTPDVAAFLRQLLAAQTVHVGQPDFAETVALAQKSMAQLDEVINGHPETPLPPRP